MPSLKLLARGEAQFYQGFEYKSTIPFLTTITMFGMLVYIYENGVRFSEKIVFLNIISIFVNVLKYKGKI